MSRAAVVLALLASALAYAAALRLRCWRLAVSVILVVLAIVFVLTPLRRNRV